MFDIASLRRRLHRHGVGRTLYAYGMRATNRVVHFRILRGLYVEEPRAQFLQCPAGYTAGFATRDALREFADDPANELSHRFVEQALAAGAECFAICDRGALVSYSWYGFRPARTDVRNTLLHFGPGWVYMHKGFTVPGYRGRRLYSHGVTMALRHYLARGYVGLLAYVDSTNFGSLKSSGRAGFRSFGSILVLRAFGRRLALSSPGCGRVGFRLEPDLTGAGLAAPRWESAWRSRP